MKIPQKFLIISGTVDIVFDDKTYKLSAADHMNVDANVHYAMQNTSNQPAMLYYTKSE